MKIFSEKGERDLIGYYKNQNFHLKILYVHAQSAIDMLSNSTADVAISGKDLLFNSTSSIQKKIKIYKDLDFGYASLKIFRSIYWIDCQSLLDVSEIARNKPLKLITKYRLLVENFLAEKNVRNVEVIDSKGATEIAARINACSLVAEIESSGKTAAANDLVELNDGLILKTSAALMVSKKSYKRKEVIKLLKLLSS
jgi:ATP phosphoribosyltransferase